MLLSAIDVRQGERYGRRMAQPTDRTSSMRAPKLQDPGVSRPASHATHTRIWRSPWSDFHLFGEEDGDESVRAVDIYTDRELRRIAAAGFNAIWVHIRLERIVPSSVFPEFGIHSDRHVDAMTKLIARAAHFGLDVYGYAQPPRGVLAEDPFWDTNSDVTGAPAVFGAPPYADQPFRALCTSTARVRHFLAESPRVLFEQLPALAGLILITASEAPSHCYGRYRFSPDALDSPDPWVFGPGRPIQCPRCAQRTPADVIGEIVTLVAHGAHEAKPDARVIVWNWSWSFLEPDPSSGIINALPADVAIMADFERGGTRKIGDSLHEVDEYSLSYAGPSARFTDTVELAHRRGLPTLAKLQLSTTHELATVPSLPVLAKIEQKATAFADSENIGFMGCWNMGNALSLNALGFNYFLDNGPFVSSADALERLSLAYFPGADPAFVRAAWEKLGHALEAYPFAMSFLYFSPVNYALTLPMHASPVSGTPVGASWIDHPRGDDLSASLADLPLELVIDQLTTLAREWGDAARVLECAVADVEQAASTRAHQEVGNAWAAYAAFASARNHYRLFALKQSWQTDTFDQDSYDAILGDEINALEAALPWLGDDEMGWHAEAQTRMFDRDGIENKIADLRRQLNAETLAGE